MRSTVTVSEPSPFLSTTSKRPLGFAISSTATPRRTSTAGEAPPARAAASAASRARSGRGSPSWVPQPGSGLRNAQITRVPGVSSPSWARARTAVCAEWPAPARSTVLPAQSAFLGEIRDVAPDFLAKTSARREPGCHHPQGVLGWPQVPVASMTTSAVSVHSLPLFSVSKRRNGRRPRSAVAISSCFNNPCRPTESTRVPSRRLGAISGRDASGSNSFSASSWPVGQSAPPGTSRPAASRCRRMRGETFISQGVNSRTWPQARTLPATEGAAS